MSQLTPTVKRHGNSQTFVNSNLSEAKKVFKEDHNRKEETVPKKENRQFDSRLRFDTTKGVLWRPHELATPRAIATHA
ncbi:hypothetical protein PUN28_017962 [Cardiocondyla obscurior]|uniref:Uncharacterized protein n=1 Tax=Cardiocondyla obscurior TaxID=286306 RepID=A0AAW2EHC5_9HYME